MSSIGQQLEPIQARRNTEALTARQSDFSAYVPRVRPHYRRRDGNVFFMISKRPSLEMPPEEVPLYDTIDGRKTLGELEQLFPNAGVALSRWREAAIIELIPPITSPSSPHLVVIEPHQDDAVLSAGGRLLHRRGHWRITILTVFKWSNFTSYLMLKKNFRNVRDITDLRLQESALVARLLGSEHRCLDCSEAPLRLCPAERWSPATVERFDEIPRAFVNRFPDSKEVSLVAEQLMQQLIVLAPDELWIPMGLGDHLDHRTARSACLRSVDRGSQPFLWYSGGYV